MDSDLINKTIFNVLNIETLEEVLSLLLKGSISKNLSSDLFWMAVSDSLLCLSSKRICSLGFVSLGLSTPINSDMSIRECQLRVAQVNDLGASLLNDLECLLISDKTKFDAIVISCPSLAAICLLSSKFLNILKSLGSGKLIFSVNINAKNDAEPITLIHGSIFWSEMVVRRLIHQSGFKRIRRIDDFANTESWKHESKLISGKDSEFKPFYPYSSKTDSFYSTAFVCDLGFNNVD